MQKENCPFYGNSHKKVHFVGTNSQVYCDKLQNGLSVDFSRMVRFYKEANCPGLEQNHNYVFVLPTVARLASII